MAIQWNSNFNETMPFTDVVAQFNLSANNEQTWTIPGSPSTKYQALFGFNYAANIFVCNNASITIPASGAMGTEQYSEVLVSGAKRYVSGGDVLHLKTPDTTQYVSVGLRQLPG